MSKVEIIKNPHIDLPLAPNEQKTMDQCARLSSHMWEGRIDGKIACIWGLVPPSLMSTRAYIWLYTNDTVEDHQFVFVRYSQLMIEEMLKEYEVIEGHCHADAKRSIRWLKWLGAEFQPLGNKRVAFTIRKK